MANSTYKFSVINDAEFEKISVQGQTFWRYEIEKRKYNNSIVILPMHKENYGNVIFWKLKAWCLENDCKLVCFGLLNQLPVFSLFADEVILQEHGALPIYEQFSLVHNLQCHCLPELTKATLVEVPTYYKDHVALLDNKHGNELLAKAAAVTDEKIVEIFCDKPMVVRKSSWDFFQKLPLSSNMIMCETGKPSGDIFRNWLTNNGKRFSFSINRSHEYKANLARECQTHYMSVQALAACYKNWFYVCQGGAANLVSVMPHMKPILLYEKWIIESKTVQRTLHDFYTKKYGNAKIPVIFGCYPKDDAGFEESLGVQLDIINGFMNDFKPEILSSEKL